MAKRKQEKRELKWWEILLIILAVLWILDALEEACEEEFTTYTHSAGCYTACDIKCSDEGFKRSTDSYTIRFPESEGERRKCSCSCEGCKW